MKKIECEKKNDNNKKIDHLRANEYFFKKKFKLSKMQ